MALVEPDSDGASSTPGYDAPSTSPTSSPPIAGHPGFAFDFHTALHNPIGVTPDDSEVPANLPSVQIDYLSEWQDEEDIWNSWKFTTKQKANMINGLRLENASWRQWNKRKNNLKTISPETLNWLKDSDVTWLYGPLHHVPADLEPQTRKSKAEDRLGIDLATAPKRKPAKPRAQTTRPCPTPTKPILKYRSLSDVLTVPHIKHLTHPTHDGFEPSDDYSYAAPPSERTFSSYSEDLSTADSTEPESEFDATGRRRHIAFSHRVEQCISVDSDDDRMRYAANQHANGSSLLNDEDDDPSSGDDEEEALTFKTSRMSPTAQYGGYAALRRYSSTGSNRSRSSLSSSSSEPQTIAPLAPTHLKDAEALPMPSPAVVYSPSSSNKVLPIDDDDVDNAHIETAILPSETVDQPSSIYNNGAPLPGPTNAEGYVSTDDLDAMRIELPATVKAAMPNKVAGAIPGKSILRSTGTPSTNDLPQAPLSPTEDADGGRASCSSSSDSRSASHTPSSSSSNGGSIDRDNEDNTAIVPDDSGQPGKGRGEGLWRQSPHRSTAAHQGASPSLEESYLADVDFNAWDNETDAAKARPTEWSYTYGEARRDSGLFTIVTEAIGTSYDVADAVYEFGRSFFFRKRPV